VIYSFYGFSNANYAMAEMKNPRRTIRIVGPLAIAVAAALYLFSNVAYLSGASKEEIVTSGRLVVALLMKNVWGERVEGIVDMAVALAAFGSVLTMVCQPSPSHDYLPMALVFCPRTDQSRAR
jgi:amino acid transporter